ncbi:nuclease-related domain-containing protein [Actinomadura violacea]|uniref:NERD domain-containing protein n=1 Tax=Actinomadura violacea TaxID=2819934 RepID=A0ABS3S5U5_9ACTN|nr:nuclease-related domain-containing protein [Actinomadura violacea]MBO2464118.1 NERD domain-containing protein [Actinomadura violacea]
MRIEVLSDHPATQLRATDAAIARTRNQIAEHARAVDTLRRHQRASRRWWQLGKRLRHARELQAMQQTAPAVDPAALHKRAQQQAGVAAEESLTHDLQCFLLGDWTLFRGYANRRGEVDHLLVGRFGIWAIEVKGRGVRVHVTGDDWRFEKFDRYGNLVDTGVLADRRGRSWGRQVSEIAAELEKFLRSRRTPVQVRTAVVVMHDRAELGTCRRLGVDTISIGTQHLHWNRSTGQPWTWISIPRTRSSSWSGATTNSTHADALDAATDPATDSAERTPPLRLTIRNASGSRVAARLAGPTSASTGGCSEGSAQSTSSAE